MDALAQQQGWEHNWAYDGRKNLYTPANNLPHQALDFRVSKNLPILDLQKSSCKD